MCPSIGLTRGGGFFPAHGFSLEDESIAVVDEAVEDGVGERGFAEPGVPVLEG